MPVIQSGGDGYSDPHDSLRSGLTVYRDSHGYFGGSGPFSSDPRCVPRAGFPSCDPDLGGRPFRSRVPSPTTRIP